MRILKKSSYLGGQLEREKIFRKMIVKTNWRIFHSLALKIKTSNQFYELYCTKPLVLVFFTEYKYGIFQ